MDEPSTPAERSSMEKYLMEHPSDLKYERGFFHLGKPGSEDVIFFPIDIRDGRTSFGQVQILIVPRGATDSFVGRKWSDRKFLVLEHDLEFGILEKLLLKGVMEELLAPRVTVKTSKEQQKELEDTYRKCPPEAKYQKAFFRHETGRARTDLYFPVQIRAGRVVFGRPQFLMVPFGSVAENCLLGHRWVDRKALVMEHDDQFPYLERFIKPDEPDVDELSMTEA